MDLTVRVLCCVHKVGHYHRPVPRMELKEAELAEVDEPDHRTAPVHLRHMLSHAQWHHGPVQSRPVNTDVTDARNDSSVKITKSVSFAKVESIIGGE